MNKFIYYYDENGKLTGAGTSFTVPINATELPPNTDRDFFDGEIWVTPELSLSEKITLYQNQNKSACKAFILSKYTEETQRNASLGLYTEEVVSAMADHIARIIAEENRVFDLLENSSDPQSVESPTWPEV